jgi:hypothetical protein
MLKGKLKNKSILFFSVQTFNLEKEIIKKLEEFGAKVHYYDERPANNNFTKGIIRLKRSLYQHRIDKYYKDILENSKSELYDFLFVNRGEVVPAFFLEELKIIQPQCEFVFYTWDSFANHTHPTTILKYFDRKFTFDPVDAVKYNINFRPLFYLDSYKDIKIHESLNKYDLLFLGTAHSDRYRIGNFIVNWCNNNSFTTFCYYYMHGKLVYLYKKIFDKTFQEFDFKKLSFKSLTSNQILELYKTSNVILDINHPGQKGLTMRTFESIGARKKMITTNKEIKKYPFYDANNIFVIDRNDIKLELDFFQKKYKEINPELYEKASIEGWLKCVFLESESNVWIEGIK